jgi:hypothetical protein
VWHFLISVISNNLPYPSSLDSVFNHPASLIFPQFFRYHLILPLILGRRRHRSHFLSCPIVRQIGSAGNPRLGASHFSLFRLPQRFTNLFIVRTLLFASRLEAVASMNIFLFLFPGFAGLLAILSSGNRLRIHRHASPNSIAYTLAYFATFAGSVAVFIGESGHCVARLLTQRQLPSLSSFPPFFPVPSHSYL